MTDYRPVEFGHLPWLLKLAEREVGKELDRELRHTGLTKSQFGVLQALVHLKRASSAALARTVFVTPQAMVNIVAELERKGFIKRRASPASARVIEATVTAAGRTAFEEGTKRIRSVDELLASEFDDRELTRFLGYLERCVAVLQQSHSR
jgi:DNA-binding MarR family transcriptional regulator